MVYGRYNELADGDTIMFKANKITEGAPSCIHSP